MLSQDFVNVSLSHATMRPEDLIPTFMFFLEEHNPKVAAQLTSSYSGEGWPYSQAGLAFGEFDDTQTELSEYLLDDLFNALNNIAPEGTYFGAHPGDGADYGFWTVEDEA